MLASPMRPMYQRRDIGCRLLEQLQEFLGSECRIVEGRQKPWASITFTGRRYRFEICGNEDGKPELIQSRLAMLPDHTFELPGQFVADILVQQPEPGDCAFVIDILAIADPVCEPVRNMSQID